jgi:hypothetical protein
VGFNGKFTDAGMKMLKERMRMWTSPALSPEPRCEQGRRTDHREELQDFVERKLNTSWIVSSSALRFPTSDASPHEMDGLTRSCRVALSDAERAR